MTDERKPYGGLSEAEIDAIAERAAQRALEHVYANFGRGVLRKLTWLAASAVLSLLIWLAGSGIIKP